ncbi:hypothetical protein MTO96_027011 [Rhipicephalus appendiculatus]
MRRSLNRGSAASEPGLRDFNPDCTPRTRLCFGQSYRHPTMNGILELPNLVGFTNCLSGASLRGRSINNFAVDIFEQHQGTHILQVVLVLCHLRPQYSFSPGRSKQPPQILGMVAMAIALPPPSVNEVRLECDMFVTRLGFDFRIAHCEPRVADLLDYSPEDLAGRNLYALVHGQDVHKLRKCHVDQERSPGRAAEPSPKGHEAPPSSTPALGGSQDVPSEQQQHLTQLGTVGKLDSLRNAKVLVHPGSLDYATPQEQQLYAGGFHLYGKPNGAWYSQQPNT